MRRVCLLAVLFVLYTGSGLAHTSMPQDFVCPLDGEAFTSYVTLSGTSFGLWLDLEPFGAIVAPPPLPECPKDGFLLYKKDFSAEELEMFRQYVALPEYQALRNAPGQYWRYAHLLEKAGAPLAKRAYVLLQSTWEAGPEQYPAWAEKTLALYGAALSAAEMEEKEMLTARLVSGELERRLGRFDDADARFAILEKDEGCLALEWCREVVARERALIQNKDSSKQLLRPLR